MGSQLVRVVVGRVFPRPDLDHAARVVMVTMAVNARDDDEQPVYYAGWKPLAACLGYEEHAPDSAAQRAVTRAIRQLRAAGLVSPDPSKPRHYKRDYRLHLDP